MSQFKHNKPQLVILLIASSILTHAFGQIQTIKAASTSSSSETTSSSQPLWSYQVKPNGYANVHNVQSSPYASNLGANYGIPSIFDTLNGLSQRQGALSGSPFLSILPIILIAAGGMLLLLPLLTMMMATPFGGGFGGYNNNFGYPQVGALNKKRSLGSVSDKSGLVELIEHVSSSIEELTKKYSTQAHNNTNGLHKRSKAATSSQQGPISTVASTGAQVPNEVSQSMPANHRKSSTGELSGDNIVSNTLGS